MALSINADNWFDDNTDTEEIMRPVRYTPLSSYLIILCFW